MFSSVLDEVSPEYEDKINMYKVDIESEPDMAIEFGARALPYMVFISKDGNVTQNVGSLGKDSLQYYLEGLISK